MVVSHLLSPLRTLKTKARAVGKSSSGSIDGWSDGPDDDGGGNGPAGGGTDEAAPGRCMAVGLCLCCGSKVSYPDTVACFRCTVCDTINDLKEVVRTEKVVEDGRLVSRPRRPPPPLTLGRLRAGVQAYKKHPEKHSLLEAMIYESFGSWDVLNVSFPSGTEMSADDPAIAFAEVHSAYKTILALPPPFIRAMMSGIEQVLRRPGRPLKAREDIRYLVIIMENPLLLQQSFPQESSYHHHIVKSIIGILANLPNRIHYSLVLWLSQHSRTSLKRKVILVNQFIAYRVRKYDRARCRSNQQRLHQQTSQQQQQQQQHMSLFPQRGVIPLTSYTSQSNQTELPAFRRQRSVTNAPFHSDHLRMASGLTRHTRMRSNTDSCVSLCAHTQLPLSGESSQQQQQQNSPGLNAVDSNSASPPAVPATPPEPPHRKSSTNPFYARAKAAQQQAAMDLAANKDGISPESKPDKSNSAPASRSDLGIGGGGAGKKAAAARFVSLGSSRKNSSSKDKGPLGGPEWPFRRVPTAPQQIRRPTPDPQLAGAFTTISLAAAGSHPPGAARETPKHATGAVGSNGSSDGMPRMSYFVPLRSSGAVPSQTSSAAASVPTPCPPRSACDIPRLRATSLSTSNIDLLTALDQEDKENGLSVDGPADAVRPSHGSVMGVLDGTAEPSSPAASFSPGRSSLARARSSSEAPTRRRQSRFQQRMRADDGILALVGPQASQTVGDWGAGVDLDDYYVGADGVFYPKTSSLVMHQHDWRLVTAAKVMALLHAANLLLSSRSRLPVEEFYNAAVDNMDLIADYDAWQTRITGAFSFCQYPFLLSLRAKVQIMQVDAARQMDSKLKEAVISALFQSHRSRLAHWNAAHHQPHLKLLVRRKCLVEDSFHQLATREQDLKKRLKIEFVDEEGIDAGGLTKEWFMLLMRELMNPIYGMFTREADTDDMHAAGADADEDDKAVSWGGAYWFNPASLETSNQYFLVGVVVGLALYNSIILDLHLPLAVFKKLLRSSFYQHSTSAMLPAARAADSVSTTLVSGSHVQPDGTSGPVVAAAAAAATAVPAGGRAACGAGKAAPTLAPKGAPKRGALAPCYGLSTTGGGVAEGRSPIYGLLSPSAQLRYQINEMLTDVSQFRPQLARGLRQLLQYREDNVEDVFCLSFEASYDAYGEVVTVPLVPNGGNIPVTSSNRVEYVVRYLQWVLNDSIARQFEPFRRGFYYVCGSNALSLFKPEEIELMVHGSGADWSPEELQAVTEYAGLDGQPGAQQLIDWFWEVLREMAAADRRLFLAFVTGSDRMPTFISSRMRLKLMLLGADYRRFPIAHTCFNQLGLWLYRSKAELRGKLLVAIKESEGFGLK